MNMIIEDETNIRIRHSPDRAHFLSQRPPGKAIRVRRAAKLTRVREDDGRLRRVPIVELAYSFIDGNNEWVFTEVRLADENGLVDLEDTLWAQLEQEGGYRLLRPSGSF